MSEWLTGLLSGVLLACLQAVGCDVPHGCSAPEAVLRSNLLTIRDVLGQYYNDKGHYPPSLQALVDDKYLWTIPVDPITGSAETWVVVVRAGEGSSVEVVNVWSGAHGTTRGGRPYREL